MTRRLAMLTAAASPVLTMTPQAERFGWAGSGRRNSTKNGFLPAAAPYIPSNACNCGSTAFRAASAAAGLIVLSIAIRSPLTSSRARTRATTDTSAGTDLSQDASAGA